MNEAVVQLRSIVDTARQVVDQLTTGSVMPYSLFEFIETQEGFGITSGHGLALLYGDVTNASPSAWSLQLTAAMAFDIPHRPEIGMWVNERNRQSVLGKYYYVVTPDHRMSAVMWEMFAWSRLLSDFGGMHGQGLLHWLKEIVNESLDASTRQTDELITHFGGRRLGPTEQDLTTLLAASSG